MNVAPLEVTPARPRWVVIADLLSDRGAPDAFRIRIASGARVVGRRPFLAQDNKRLYISVSRTGLRSLQAKSLDGVEITKVGWLRRVVMGTPVSVDPVTLLTVEYRRATWGPRLALGVVVLGMGILVGAMAGFQDRSTATVLGGLLGAFAAPLVVWLTQDAPPFASWRVLSTPADA